MWVPYGSTWENRSQIIIYDPLWECGSLMVLYGSPWESDMIIFGSPKGMWVLYGHIQDPCRNVGLKWSLWVPNCPIWIPTSCIWINKGNVSPLWSYLGPLWYPMGIWVLHSHVWVPLWEVGCLICQMQVMTVSHCPCNLSQFSSHMPYFLWLNIYTVQLIADTIHKFKITTNLSLFLQSNFHN